MKELRGSWRSRPHVRVNRLSEMDNNFLLPRTMRPYVRLRSLSNRHRRHVTPLLFKISNQQVPTLSHLYHAFFLGDLALLKIMQVRKAKRKRPSESWTQEKRPVQLSKFIIGGENTILRRQISEIRGIEHLETYRI